MKLNASHLWKVLSLLVPVPEAYAVGLAIIDTLHWDLTVVVISSVIVALTGFLAIDITNRMSEFNVTLSEEERQQRFTASMWRGFIVLSIWFVGVMLLTVFLKVTPSLAIWTPLGLVVVGSSAAWLRSINKGQDAREQAVAQFREQRAQELRKQKQQEEKRKEEIRKARQSTRKLRQEEEKREASIKQAISSRLQGVLGSKLAGSSGSISPSDGSANVSDGSTEPSVEHPSGAKRRAARKGALLDEQLVFEYQLNPSISSGELAEKFKVSRQAIDQRRDALARDGILKLVKSDNGRVVSIEVNLTDWVEVGQGT